MHTPAAGATGETVLLNGLVYRAPGAHPPAPALAIRDGAIVHLGSADAARSRLPDARIIDLGGRTVLPAFVDSHTHFHRAAILRALYLDFEALRPRSIADVQAAVRERAASLPEGDWIQGDSITAAGLAEGRLPDRHELDAAAPRHLVLIRGIGKHVVAANSAALAAAGIDRDTPDPTGGHIERDDEGHPTGVLHEQAKLRLDASATDTVVPAATADERRAALRTGIAELHRLGIATIHEMVRQVEEAADWGSLYAAEQPRLRVRLFYRVHESPFSLDWLTRLGIRTGFGSPWLGVAGVKISVDGWCIFRNAAVYEPFHGGPATTGIMRIEQPELTRLVGEADRAGLRVAVHAVGARAVDAALDAFEAAAPWQSGPHRIEHAHLDVDGSRLDRIARLGLILSAQPGFLQPYLADWALSLEPDRIDGIMPLASAAARDIPILLNSDVPSGPAGPLATIAAAVDRRAGNGWVGRGEALTLEQAWLAHTSSAAITSGTAPALSGRLEAGQPADLIVLDEDPFADLGPVPRAVAATMIDGEIVHDPEGRLA